MSGRSISIVAGFMSGVRVLGQLNYVPAHINAQGKEVNARVTIPVRANSHRGFDSQGNPGRKDDFKLTAWGKLADTCARSCSPGKALDVVVGMNSFKGKVFNPDGTLRLDQAGQVIETARNGFTIREIVFGEESRKHINNEIQAGLRPADWDVPGSPGAQAWLNILQQRQAAVWDGQSGEFMYARVTVPQGVRLMGQAPAAPVYNAPAAPVAPVAPATTPVVGTQPLPTQVATVLPAAGAQPQPGVAPVATAPVAPVVTAPAANAQGF